MTFNLPIVRSTNLVLVVTGDETTATAHTHTNEIKIENRQCIRVQFKLYAKLQYSLLRDDGTQSLSVGGGGCFNVCVYSMCGYFVLLELYSTVFASFLVLLAACDRYWCLSTHPVQAMVSVLRYLQSTDLQ